MLFKLWGSFEEIHEYIAIGEPLEKAGGYAIQLIGAKFIDRTEGDMDNIIGLPVSDVVEELKNFGVFM